MKIGRQLIALNLEDLRANIDLYQDISALAQDYPIIKKIIEFIYTPQNLRIFTTSCGLLGGESEIRVIKDVLLLFETIDRNNDVKMVFHDKRYPWNKEISDSPFGIGKTVFEPYWNRVVALVALTLIKIEPQQTLDYIMLEGLIMRRIEDSSRQGASSFDTLYSDEDMNAFKENWKKFIDEMGTWVADVIIPQEEHKKLKSCAMVMAVNGEDLSWEPAFEQCNLESVSVPTDSSHEKDEEIARLREEIARLKEKQCDMPEDKERKLCEHRARMCVAIGIQFDLTQKRLTQEKANEMFACLTDMSPSSFTNYWADQSQAMRNALDNAKKIKNHKNTSKKQSSK